MLYKKVAADSDALIGRIPYKIVFSEKGELLFKWLYVGQKKFEEPFFSETISKCLCLAENSNMPYTDEESLVERANSIQTVTPTAFIFHVSRCGSTLLTQMLCLDDSCIVLPEVPLLDDVLQLPYSNPGKNTQSIQVLYCAVLRLLGWQRSAKEKQLFVKTDSWHLMFFETIRQMFPDVPACIVYRSPKEVIRSQQKFRGMHAVKGLIQHEIFGLTLNEFEAISYDDYLEFVVNHYFEKSLEVLLKDQNTIAISYQHGALQISALLLDACGITFSQQVLLAMQKRSGKHSKNPRDDFTGEAIIPETTPHTIAEKIFFSIRVNPKISKITGH